MLKYNRINLPKVSYYRKCLTTSSEEYTDTPQYPPILDLSYEKKAERLKLSKHEEIKKVRTVEEKQIKLNMPRYYGFKTYLMQEDYIPYNNLALTQHVTRTHLIETPKLPTYYDSIELSDIQHIQNSIQETILSEIEGYRKEHDIKSDVLMNSIKKDNLIGGNIGKQMNRIILNFLCRNDTNIFNYQVDHDARIESSWYCGGMNPPERVKSYRRGSEWQKERENEPTDRVFLYLGNPSVTLRSDQPLPLIVSESEAENPALEVPFFKYDPRVVGISTDYLRIVNIPGYWPGDVNKFGIISYLKRGHFTERHYGDNNDHQNSVHRQGILSSFAWLQAQANMLGFTTFNDVTYPLVTQTVITNGQLFSFYTYQLNTLLLHSKNTTENPKRNICWATPELKLYEKIEDNKIIGFNDEVLLNLLKYYMNKPKPRLGVNLTPYLSEKEKTCADYDDVEKRVWLEREYKFLMSKRPRHYLMDEMYHWEKIYKVDNDTRFMDKRSRFFQLRIKPSDRTLDDRKPTYIPRALRPDLPKNKGRDAKEFWP